MKPDSVIDAHRRIVACIDRWHGVVRIKVRNLHISHVGGKIYLNAAADEHGVAVVNAYYDEFTKILRTNFTIGEPFIRIREVLTRELSPDEINKVSLIVRNEWNTELSINGFLEINQRKTEMPVFRIGAEEEREITGFFDTTGFMPGDYNMSITLIYAKQIKTHTFPITITEMALKPEKPQKTLLLIGGVVLMLIVIIILLIIFIIKKRKSLRERNL